MLLLNKFSAFVFDMDGTLVDSGRLHEQAWTETLVRFGLPVDREFMRSLAGVPTIATIEQVITKFGCSSASSSSDMARFKEAFVEKHFKRFVKPTDLVRVVKEYHGRVPMSVGTGAHTAEAISVLSACGLLDYIDYIVGADKVSQPKPSPDTFLLCAELMGVQPSDCVVFEDAKAGLEAARQAGMTGLDVLEVFAIENDYFL